MRAQLAYHGVPFEVAQVVQTSERIPGIGMVQNPLLVGPAISVSVSPVGRRGADGREIVRVHVHWCISNVKGPAQRRAALEIAAGLAIDAG